MLNSIDRGGAVGCSTGGACDRIRNCVLTRRVVRGISYIQVVDKKELCPSRAKSLRRGGVAPPQNYGGQGTHNVSRLEKSGTCVRPRGHTTQALDTMTPHQGRPAPARTRDRVPARALYDSTASRPHSHHSPPTLRLRRPAKCRHLCGTFFLASMPASRALGIWCALCHTKAQFWCPTQKTCPNNSFCPPLVCAKLWDPC
jgi:hypothetical protein